MSTSRFDALPWLALGVGVAGIGAAAWSERHGSASTRYTPDFFWTQIVPSATRRAAEEKAPILVTFEDRFNAWGMMSGQSQPRTRRLFAVIDAKGHVEHGPAWDASFDRGSAADGSLARATPVLFHVSPASNRASIERHGLRAPAYLVADASGASAIASAHREDGEVVDTWRVDAGGLDVERDPEQPDHWSVTRKPVPASRVTLLARGSSNRHPWAGPAAAVADYRTRSARGSAAVDLAKRYRDLQRVASASSGATANERATAQRLLAKMTPPAPQRQAPRTPSSGGYGYAPPRRQAQPWQTDPRDSSEIYQNDLTDLNFAKKAIYEHASAPRLRVSLQGFDGSYGRSSLTALSSLDDLGYAAEVLEAWGEPYFKKDGVFDAVIGVVGGAGSDVRVLRIRGEDVSDLGLTLDHDSFNANPFNDTSFARRLRALVEAHAARMR